MANDIADWSKAADLICVATCANKAPGPDYQYDKYATYKTTNCTFTINLVLKGEKTTSSCELPTYVLDVPALIQPGVTTFSYTQFYTGFLPNNTYLLFLKLPTDGAMYRLVDPHDRGESAVLLPGNPQVGAVGQNLPLDILHVVTASLNDSDEAVRVDGIYAVGNFGSYLTQNVLYGPNLGNPKFGLNRTNGAVALQSSGYGSDSQPVVTDLQSVVMPLLRQNLVQADPDVHNAALIALGELQDTSVIPGLVLLGSKGSSYSWRALSALTSYGTDQSAEGLAPYLTSANDQVREAIGQSLMKSQDPALIPMLLGDLNDPDWRSLYYVITCLYNITGNISPCLYLAFPTQENKYIAFWTFWAQSHHYAIGKQTAS